MHCYSYTHSFSPAVLFSSRICDELHDFEKLQATWHPRRSSSHSFPCSCTLLLIRSHFIENNYEGQHWNSTYITQFARMATTHVHILFMLGKT